MYNIEFNVEQIEYIKFTQTQPDNIYFQNEIPEDSISILGIFKWIKRPYQPEGYRKEEPPRRWRDGFCTGWNIPTTISKQELAEHRTLYLQKYPKGGEEVRKKAKVYIQKRKSWHTAFFDSNELAIDFINEIKEKTTSKFQLIEEK